MKVKICGITNREDAVWALNYGAELIGLDFRAESKRRLSPASARTWVPDLPTFASVVGVFADERPDRIARIAAELNLKGVQLNGDQTPEQFGAVRQALAATECPPFIIKGFRIAGPGTLDDLPRFAPVIDYVLLYDPAEGAPDGAADIGGWDLAAAGGKPVFLGGGLTPGNVRDAVKKAAPFGVDVTAGVERSPRRKDLDKMRDFIANALAMR